MQITDAWLAPGADVSLAAVRRILPSTLSLSSLPLLSCSPLSPTSLTSGFSQVPEAPELMLWPKVFAQHVTLPCMFYAKLCCSYTILSNIYLKKIIRSSVFLFCNYVTPPFCLPLQFSLLPRSHLTPFFSSSSSPAVAPFNLSP